MDNYNNVNIILKLYATYEKELIEFRSIKAHRARKIAAFEYDLINDLYQEKGVYNVEAKVEQFDA